MKKILSIFSVCAMIICLGGCGNSAENSSSQAEPIESAETSLTEKVETIVESTENETEATEIPEESGNSKILVAYFSATGTTKVIAETIANESGADIYEILPAEPYSDADLNYNDDNCRANREQNDGFARPEISGEISNFVEYDTIIIGHPIWWGVEPKIMDTFMESYDFSGKNIAHFCTSGGSGIASSDKNLQTYCPDSNWLGAKKFSDSSEVSDWLTEIGLK